MQDYLSHLTPQYWPFWIGLVLMAIVLIGRDRITTGPRRSASWRPARLARLGRAASIPASEGTDMPVVLETIGLTKRFSGLIATNDVSLRIEKGARHALIGPNGAGKTTLINLLTGVLRAERRPYPARRRGHRRRCRRTSAWGSASCAPSRSTSCSAT